MTRGKGHARTSTPSPIPCAPAAMRGLGRGRVVSEPVRLLDERRYDPPRHVEVELNGQWWPGLQHAWRLTWDRDHWVADVEFAAVYDWGLGKHFHCVPPGRVRVGAAEAPHPPTRRRRRGRPPAAGSGVAPPLEYCDRRCTTLPADRAIGAAASGTGGILPLLGTRRPGTESA